MGSVTLRIASTIDGAVALTQRARRHVKCRCCASTEVVVTRPHSCVQHKDRRASPSADTRISTDPVQAPRGCLNIRLDLGDHVHSLIWLDELDDSIGTLYEALEVALRPSHLQEWHTTFWVAHQIAPIWGYLAQLLHLGIRRASLDHHHPLPGHLAGGRTKGRLSLIRRVVVQHRDTCNELDRATSMTSSLLRDACPLGTCEQHSERTQATRQSDHSFCWGLKCSKDKCFR